MQQCLNCKIKIERMCLFFSLFSPSPSFLRSLCFYLLSPVAAPVGRSRVGFSFCEAAEGVRSEAPRGRGAADAETSAEGARGGGRIWRGGIPLRIRLGCLGERRKLPQRGLGRSPSQNRFWCILPLKSDLWCQQFP